MKPVGQTKFHEPGVARGNCFAACLASILELTIDQVPAVEELFDAPGRSWVELLFDWAQARGLELEVGASWRAFPAHAYLLATGPGPRGCGHACVYQDGRLAHDPHPSAAGLLSVDFWWSIRPRPSAGGE